MTTSSQLVRRLADHRCANGRRWTGNAATKGDHHHGLVNENENPCTIHLSWRDATGHRVTDVGCFELHLAALAQAGYVVRKPGAMVRVRFVREHDGHVVLQVNASGPRLPVGSAVFR